MKKLKVFISQPMRGRTRKDIYLERIRIKEILEANGNEVIDNIMTFEDELLSQRSNIKNKDLYYLSHSLEKLCQCNAIYMCDNWKLYRGCVFEYKAAEAYGLTIITGVEEDNDISCLW